MKLKLSLLFLVVVGFGSWGKAQVTKPYTQLLITEAQMGNEEQNYFEITNMGAETIDLGNFEFGHLGSWDKPWDQATNPKKFMILPKGKMLAPGKSYLIASVSDYNPENFKKDPANYRERVTRKEFYTVKGLKVYTIADMLLHRAESPGPAKTDSVSADFNAIEGWGGRETYFLRHHFINALTLKIDSAVIDQVGGIFDEADGTNGDHAYDVAGVLNATFNCVLIRRNSVTTGNLDFNTGRGLSYEDSEWIPIPILGWYDGVSGSPWRAVFWTAGNQSNAVLDANTLVSKTGKVLVDLANYTITVPWGVRKDDSIMFQFKKTPGLAWGYDYAPISEDSSYLTARTGDILKLYVCGDVAKIQDFKIINLEPTPSDNIVIPKTGFDYANGHNYLHPSAFGGMRITDGVSIIDSITNLAYATRVDTLFKYLEKAPKATWKIVYKNGAAKPDLTIGDILRVTSENNRVKDYFIKLDKFSPSSNALLSAITWPDIPLSFKGAFAGILGWKGDTIPGFAATSKTYVVQIPLDYNGIPALVFTKQQLDSRVVVKRAKSLAGSAEDRTATFTVTAENDTVISVYTVRFDKEKDLSNVQPFIADPFISQIVYKSEWFTNFIEIANPGTEPLDFSNYMITQTGGTDASSFGWYNQTTDWDGRYSKYIPGKKWQDEANWLVKPRIAMPDNAVNSIVYPGDVFVMGWLQNCDGWINPKDHPSAKEMDINFGITDPNTPSLDNPWNEVINNAVTDLWDNNSLYLYKILNDSVKNGTKPATDRNDFQLIDCFGGVGGPWSIEGFDGNPTFRVGYTRNPNIYKGNPQPNGSFGTSLANSEWTFKTPDDYTSFNLGWPWTDIAICTGIGSVTMDEVTMYKSTVTSKVYKVSPGYGLKETIRGLTTGTAVTGFYQNLMKANADQELKVKSATTGIELASAAEIANGDTLVVLSSDKTNTSKYILDVTVGGLNHDAVLTSTPYTIDVTTTTGTVGGFDKNTLLKTVVENVAVPAGASMEIINSKDAYMSLLKVNYDSLYVDVVATDEVFFEVIAEDGITKITYQLKPNSSLSDAYVTSDIYSVDQIGSVIGFVPGGSTVHTVLGNVTAAPGATMAIFDKGGFQRTDGAIYRDDKLVVTAADGITTKAYYFSMLHFYANIYMAFVLSDVYKVDQVAFVIKGATLTSTISEFKANLYPSFGANLKVVNASGIENTSSTFVLGDKLLVTAADGSTTATYLIEDVTGNTPVAVTSSIKMYPNPTSGRVTVMGLAKGNRLQVLNTAGITLRDVIVENSTDYVSLEAQPVGIYIFVISAGNQHLNIQKIIKK